MTCHVCVCACPRALTEWRERGVKDLTEDQQLAYGVGSRASCRNHFHLVVGVLIHLSDDPTFAFTNPDEEYEDELNPVRALMPYGQGVGAARLAVETMPVYGVIRPPGSSASQLAGHRRNQHDYSGGDSEEDDESYDSYLDSDDYAIDTNLLNEIIFSPRRDDNCSKVKNFGLH